LPPIAKLTQYRVVSSGASEEADAIAEEAYAVARSIFAPTHRLLGDLALLLVEIEGGAIPQKPLPQNTEASLQLPQEQHLKIEIVSWKQL